MSLKTLKKIFKRSVWTMLTIFFSVFLAIIIVGSDIANGYQAAINGVLHTSPYLKVETGEPTGPDTDYFKSDYTKKDKDGNTLYEKDAEGAWRPVYDDEAMRANSYDVALQTAVEGSVLLFNNEQTLPLAENSRVSLFGISSVNYSYLAGGSGGMSVVTPNNIRTAFSDAGLSLNIPLYMNYVNLASDYGGNRLRSVNEVPWEKVRDTAASSVESGDTAVMIMTRIGDEHTDIVPWIANDHFVEDKNYLDITEEEAGVLSNLCEMKKEGKLARVVLLLNSSNALQFKHLSQYDIDACVWVGMGGSMSYSQLASVLSGKGDYVLSGRLPDTFVYDNASTPVSANFGDFQWTQYSDKLPDLADEGKYTFGSYNTKYIVYQEGIYVGYRYYETRYEDQVTGSGNAVSAKGAKMGATWDYKAEVAYPFGHGLSYTGFSYDGFKVDKEGEDYKISVTVTNTGSDYAGREVVQVYLQKPYTDYDKEKGIEKAAVELVGFTKTKKLSPGESQTVTVDVKGEDFKCYDADGEGTYILEKGDYYLAAGVSSHDALNNILAKKGYTPENTDGRMDKAGDASFVEKITVGANDFEKYAVSSATGNEIVNRFDTADLNRYTSTEQKVKYLSRSDWEGTYPETAVSLYCTEEAMVEDMQYGHPVEVKEGDTMPKYGEVTADEGELSLIMLRELDFDDEKWQDLLNQMTVEEQQFLMSYGLNHLAGVASVNAPGTESRDGPAGLKENNPTLGSTMSFPGEVLLSSTFDTELVEKLGRAFGMEILHAGFTVIYGPGGCIHRSPYSGRNWEYFSEDGFLTGKMLAAEVTGLQKYGVIVLTKHFALNDEETNRYGVATFANEQSIREIYLKAFELAVTEGRMNGVMSSFNRIGTTWAGAHKGLLTDVLRGEWGFNGMVETDSCTGTTDYVHHMTTIYAKAEGLMAGNDVWMCGTGSESFVSEHLDNPTVMLALREACHRVLYAQLHSNAMNGMSSTTKIVRVKTWWQKALDGMFIGLTVVVCLCFVMAALSFVVNTSWFRTKYRAMKAASAHRKEVKAAYAQSGGSAGGSDGNDGGGAGNDGDGGKYNPVKHPVKWWKSLDLRGKIISIVAIALAVILIAVAIILPCVLNARPAEEKHECGHACPECGKCLDEECTDPVCADKCEGHVHEHVCEEECPVCGKCLNLACEEEVCAEKCGEGLTAHEFMATSADLTAGVRGKPGQENAGEKTVVGNINQNTGAKLTFTVQSNAKQTVSLVVYVSLRYEDTVFTDIMYTTVNGKEISSPATVFGSEDKKNNWTTFQATNLGCVELENGVNTIEFAVLSNDELSGYNFWKIEILAENDVKVPHRCTTVCPSCGKCLDLSCEESSCADKCQEGYAKANHLVYEAENSARSNGGKGAAYDPRAVSGGSGVVITGINKNKGASLEFTVYSETACEQNLYMVVSRRAGAAIGDFFDITLNGEAYTTDATIPTEGRDYATVLLGSVSLKEGVNAIKFTVRSNEDVGFDVDKVLFFGDEPITDEIPFDEDAGVYEAEFAEFISGAIGSPRVEVGTNCTFVGNLSSNKGAGLKFKVNSTSQRSVLLKVAVTQRSKDLPFSGAYTVTVNGVVIPNEAIVPAGEGGKDNWFASVEVTLGEIELVAGVNEIIFTVPSSSGDVCFNFDKMMLEEVSCQHTYETEYTRTETHHWYAATCGHDVKSGYAPHDFDDNFVCKVCGYAKHIHTFDEENWTSDAGGHWHAATCEHTGEKQDYDTHTLVNNVCSVCGYTPEYAHTLVFEAENAFFGEGKRGNPRTENGGSGTVVGNINQNSGAALEFTVYSPAACKQDLFMSVCRRANAAVSDYIDVTINGEPYATTAVIPANANGDTGINWSDYLDVYLGEIDLAAGVNRIRFTVRTTDDIGYNFDNIKLKGAIELSTEIEDDHSQGYYQAEYAETVDGTKGTPMPVIGTNGILMGNLSSNEGAGVKFTVNAEAEKVVTLKVGVTQRSIDLPFSGAYTVTINGNPVEIWASVPAGEGGKDSWFTSVEVTLGAVQLAAGDNVILFTVASSSGDSCFNFDYLKVEDGGTIHEHEFATEYSYDSDYHWHAATCGHAVTSTKEAHEFGDGDVCTVCGLSRHEHTFADTYSHDETHHWYAATCEHTDEKQGYEAHTLVDNTCTVCGYTVEYTLRLEAEQAIPGKGNGGMPNMSDNGGQSAGNMNNNTGAALLFSFTAEEASEQKLVMRVNLNPNKRVSDFIRIEVNGTEFVTEAVLPAGTNGGTGIEWSNYVDVELGTIEVAKGLNTIKFVVVAASGTENGYNFDCITLTGAKRLSSEVAANATDPNVYEAEYAELVTGNSAPNREVGTNCVFVGNLNGNQGAGVKFTVNSEGEKTVRLKARVTQRSVDLNFAEAFNVSVNGGEPLALTAVIPASGDGSDSWFASVEVDLGEITLSAGVNEIIFTIVSSDNTKGVNFDCMVIEELAAA